MPDATSPLSSKSALDDDLNHIRSVWLDVPAILKMFITVYLAPMARAVLRSVGLSCDRRLD